MRFKAGDKVRCIDDGGVEPLPEHPELVHNGVVYTVKKHHNENGLEVEELPPNNYFHHGRFELVTTSTPMSPPKTSADRKNMPIYSGVVRYAPAALHLVAALSKKGNDKHNPGEEMHHARGKSSDHGDCILRHQMEVGTIDPDTELDHAVAVAWRALMQLQELAESRYGWPKAPGAK